MGSDDERQVARGLGVIGPTGRWRRNLVNKCLASSQPPQQALDDPRIAPKVRQLLQVTKRNYCTNAFVNAVLLYL